MRKLIAIIVVLLVASCGSSKKVTNSKPTVIKEKDGEIKVIPNKETTREVAKVITETKKKTNTYLNKNTLAYIEKYAPLAMEEMREYKIPASITLAQGILESGSGKSKLSSRSNNHFGIKCHRGWTGRRTYHDDDKKGECFRVYKYVATSYRDHSTFLAGRSRYLSLFRLKIDDYKGWAKGLKRAGYATDPKYPKKLITFIEKYNLDKYDEIVLKGKFEGIKSKRQPVVEKKETKANTSKSTPKVIVAKKEIPRKGTHRVSGEDTLYSISRKYGLAVDELKKLNGLTDNVIHEGDVLKLRTEVKRKGYYVVKKKDTLYSIAKKNKVTVAELKALNNLNSNDISIGQELRIK
ncbi:glucosaminidase domain-containing protein [Wenyingzhuangia sp. IMCC45574]